MTTATKEEIDKEVDKLLKKMDMKPDENTQVRAGNTVFPTAMVVSRGVPYSCPVCPRKNRKKHAILL